MENRKLYVTKYLFNRIIKWETWFIKDKLKNKTCLSKKITENKKMYY